MKLSLTVMLALLFTLSLNAQDTANESKISVDKMETQMPAEVTAPVDDSVEKIEVTGSHIKRINIEGASPIQTIDRESIKRTGYNSVSDVLRDLPSNSFGSTREYSGSNASGVATVNLRGLGAGKTLVLLNGSRLPLDAVSGAVDLNLIPIEAVDRIDVMKDGGSATYGSDALGGVVNIITKKNFNGAVFNTKISQPGQAGGTKQEISGTFGRTTRDSSILTVFQYRKNDKVFARNRAHSAGGRSSFSPKGFYIPVTGGEAGAPIAHQDCEGTIRKGFGGTVCTYDYNKRATSMPTLEQVSLMTDGQTRLNGSTRFKGRVMMTQRTSEYIYAPAPITDGLLIPASVASKMNNNGPLPGLTAADDVLYYFRSKDLGDRISSAKTLSYGANIGFEKDIGSSWEARVSLGKNRVFRQDKGISGFVLKDKIKELVTTGAYNPFEQSGSLETSAYSTLEKSHSDNTALEVIASGEAFEMSAGAASVAIGAQVTSEAYYDTLDDQSVAENVIGSSGSNGAGTRGAQSIFTELALPLSESAELNLSARFDNYSDFGNTVNPKVSARWQASKMVMLRTSVGTGFKAPTLQSLHRNASEGFPTFIDSVMCPVPDKNNPDCEPSQHRTVGGGNKQLKEETSIFANVGTVIQPTANWSFGFDAFYTKIKDEVTNVSGNADMLEEITKAERDNSINLAQYDIKIEREKSGRITKITAPSANLAAKEITGFEIFTETQTKTSIGRFSARYDYSQVLKFREEKFPGLGLVDVAGENGNPKWRSNISLTYSPSQSLTSGFLIKTIGTHEKENPTSVIEPDIDTYTEVDYQMNYFSSWDAKFTFGILNVFDLHPEYDDSNVNNRLSRSLYSQLGRTFYLGYEQTY